jgi:hypothetical protein
VQTTEHRFERCRTSVMGARHARQVCRHARRVRVDERPRDAGPGSIGATISRWLVDRSIAAVGMEGALYMCVSVGSGPR